MSTAPTSTPPAPERPLPTPTRESQPYWDGLREGRLILQHCAKCEKARHYPRPICPHCFSMESTWREAPLAGRIHSWTVCHHPFNFFFKSMAPYVVALVDMEAGVRVNAPLRGMAEGTLKIGAPVRLAFEPVTKDVTLPYFVAA
ncbi:MAG: Zn-ribbon domain-containing OB-fold protein [Alphaproteobacteria bacterium]|nr:Zn-ribbon domain-containing OB-fold protein [Alphaproteobacteria bacterium]